MNLTIKTNNVPRDIINLWELTEKERKDFDWVTDEGEQFFRYKGTLYALSEFMTTSMPFGAPQLESKGWDGYHSDSFFSAVLVKYTGDLEQVIVGLALS